MRVVLFQHNGRLKLDWSRQLPEIGPGLILVTSPDFTKKLRPADWAGFSQVIELASFDSAALVSALSRIQAEGPGDDLRIVTLDEDLIPVLGAIRGQLGIPGQTADEAIRFSDKIVMKEALSGLACLPRFLALPAGEERADALFDKLRSELGLPFVVKPAAAAGSHGVVTITSLSDWQRWRETPASSVACEADEMLRGTLYHVDTILRAGAPATVIPCEYTWPNAEFLHGKNLGSIPLGDGDPLARRLADLNMTILEKLEASAGIYHLEAFGSPDGRLTFLEVAARPGGGMIPELYAHVFDVNLHNEMVMASAARSPGRPAFADARIPAALRHGTWTWVPPQAGEVTQVTEPRTRGAAESYWRCGPGDPLRGPSDIVQRVGGILVRNTSAAQARTDFEYFRDHYVPLTLARSAS